MKTAHLFLALLVLAIASIVYASNASRLKVANVATSGRYCAGYRGAPIAFQCEGDVRAAYGPKLADAGTKRTTDGGAPIVPDTNDELVRFPGDPYEVLLGPSEQCAALISADGGANACTFFERTAP